MTLDPNGKEVRAVRREVLESLGARGEVLEECLRYTDSRFDGEALPPAPLLPCGEEPHLKDWRAYVEAAGDAPWDDLQARIPQLAIPIRSGVSQTDAYRAVTRRGDRLEPEAFGGRLTLEDPAGFHLSIGEHSAGALPVMVTANRKDFEALCQALAHRSEPVPVHPAVNAQTIAGFVNWDRLRRYQEAWGAERSVFSREVAWPAEQERVAATEKWRFQDRFILLCANPYGGVAATQLGLEMSGAEWLERSTVLRQEHEFTHYLTKRLYGRMSLNLLDETICDWAGMMTALGSFRSDLFLAFLGLEEWPRVRPDGRISAYRGDLGDEAFVVVAELVLRAAEKLEDLTRRHWSEAAHTTFLVALTRFTLDLLASPMADEWFEQSCTSAAALLEPATSC